MKCKDCKEEGCPFRCYTENGECSYVDFNEDSFDWQLFRAEAAKDILCHLLDRYTGDSDNKGFVEQAIGIANELVKQLKEKEEK